MSTQVHDIGIVETTTREFPVLAVNVLDSLGYNVSRASKQLNQVLAVQRLDEQIGRDWWHHEYRICLRWSDASSGVLVDLDVSETKGGGTRADCQRRCDEIILKLQDDAARAKGLAAKREKSTAHGAACWGDENTLRSAGYVTDKAKPTRLIIGRTQSDEYIAVPELLTHAHAIVCGRTGVGKSRGFFVPNLIERLGTNMIVTEATPGYEPGELYTLTSGWRHHAGHQILSFNPGDMSSTRINPVDRVRLAPQDQKAKEAEKLADLIVSNGSGDELRIDPTWDRSEKQLLISLILNAAAGEPHFGHIGAIRWLLLAGSDRVRRVISRSPSELAQMEFEGWLQSTSENFRFGVLSGLMTKLNPWFTDQLVALTETTDVDFDSLRQGLFTFYLAVPSRFRDGKLIGSLMVNFLLDFLLDNKSEMKHPTALFLDEFTNFGRISNIADVLSIIRKAKISLVLGFQNYFQLERVYSRKEAQIIFDQPATQIYFRQKSFREAKALSEALGRTTVEEVTVSDSGRVQEFAQGRALATPDELMNLKGEVIVFTGDTAPLKLAVSSPTAYEYPMNYPPPDRPVHTISEHTSRRASNHKQQSSNKTESAPPPDTGNEGKDNRSRDTRREPSRPSTSDDRNQAKPAPPQPYNFSEINDIWNPSQSE